MKRIIILVIMVTLMPIMIIRSEKSLLFEDKSLHVIAYINRTAISYNLRYGGNHLRLINMDTGNQVEWPKDADILNLRKVYYFFQFQNLILAKFDSRIAAYDILSGKLIWENGGLKDVSMEFLVKGNAGYTCDEKNTNKITLYSVNMEDGKIIRQCNLDITGQEMNRPKLYDIKDDNLLIQVGMDMICYNIKENKAKWEYKLNPYMSQARFVGDYVVASTTDYGQDCTYYIYCVEASTGKQLWGTHGGTKYALTDTHIFYYYGDPDCCKDRNKAIIKKEISSGKIVKTEENNVAHTIGCLFNCKDGLIYFNGFESNGSFGFRYRYYDTDLNLLDEQFVADAYKYNFNGSDSIEIFGDYLVTYFGERGTNNYVIYCHALPGYKPPQTKQKQQINIIGWLLQFILKKIRMLP